MSSSSSSSSAAATVVAKAIGLDSVTRHIFLCADQTKSKCCSYDDGLASWEFLKRRVKELNLRGTVARTKANCLQVCVSGPIAVVYPDGVFYHSCTPQNLELILQQHVLGGQVVAELMIAEAGRCINGLDTQKILNADKEK